MVVTVMVALISAGDCLSQIAKVRKLAALRRVREVGCQLIKLASPRGIAVGLVRLRGGLEIGRDLLGELCVLGRILLLELLKLTQDLCEGRELRILILRERGLRCRVGGG